jgi:hypothetical protein
MTAAHAVLIPPEHRLHFGLSEELGVGLVQRGPTLVSCLHVHVKQLAEVVAKTGEEAEVLPLWRTRRGLEVDRVWRDIGEDYLVKLLQHLHGDFERVLQQAIGLTVVMIGTRRQVSDQLSQPCNDASG